MSSSDIWKIAGIANLLPIFNFLDKSDRDEVARVNKAFQSMVRINKDVFKIVRRLSKKNAMEKYAKEAHTLIYLAFDIASDKEERYSSCYGRETYTPFDTDKTYYLNLRKTVWPKDSRPCGIEFRINRITFLGTKVVEEDIWVYEKHSNKNIYTGKDVGFIIDTLSFVDYTRHYRPSRTYINFFPKYIKSKVKEREKKYLEKKKTH
jgi:hypothetical protein